ncbi:MAG TPA: VTT domain-containing protein [Steroidobacteraceae bacterium]|nr:VTT domain-containing protein [Steroidobacteraceae bacterium]
MAEHRGGTSLFEPQRNCWRVAHADQAAFLIDADAYFKAFVAATEQAQRSILIAGWDFHSRTRLLCDEDGKNCELELGDYLNRLVKERRDLQIHILIWDYPMIFGLDREWAPLSGFGWKPRRRIHFRYDNTHPISASHHQKLVVVDDAVAFCGGIDLTCRRWDTCAHAADDLRRVVQGTPYPPFHDLCIAVEGDVARSLGDLIRERWRRATGETIEPVATRAPSWRRIGRKKAPNARWPKEIVPNVRDVEVAISRTEPAVNDSEGVREVENMYLDMIAAAKNSIYIENQYFTADKIGEALAKRLAEEDGPEVIIVLRELSHGWLEEVTMQTLRTRLITKLREADKHDRLRVTYPYIAGLKPGTCIDVHSKLIIVDDEFVRIGSANVANRSMGFDTECDLTIRGDRDDACDAIRELRCALLSEHLGCEPAQVQAAVEETGSLRRAIEQLQTENRTLKPVTTAPEVSPTVLDVISVADPEKPVAIQTLVEMFSPDVEPRKRKGRSWMKFAAAVAAVAALTAMWKFTPLAHWLEPDVVTGWARAFGDKPWAPLIVLAAYTPASVLMFPRPVITLFAVVAFGPWLGFLYAISGIELAAWLSYVAGQRLSRDTVRRVAGSNLNRIIEVMRRRGLIAMTALRLVPIAPFIVEGIVAGAVRIKLWHFMVGTGIGMLPGTLAATILSKQLQAALENPSDVNYWLIAAAVLIVALATWFVRRWLMGSSGQNSPQHELDRAHTA